MVIELKILNDIYKEITEVDKETKEVYTYQKLVKKDVITRKLINTASIISISETLTKQGKPYKRRCQVAIKEEGYAVVRHSYEELKQVVDHKTIGYGGTKGRN
jgi:hypothetical protein